jgi:ribonuclease Z
VKQIVDGFMRAYSLDCGYRAATVPSLPLRGWPMEPHIVVTTRSVEQTDAPESVTVLQRNGLTVTAYAVDHAPVAPAYGYRFDYKGRSVVISGDTARSANLIHAATHADLLIHEAQAKYMLSIVRQVAEEQHHTLVAQTISGIQRYHSSPVEAAEVANETGVKLLVIAILRHRCLISSENGRSCGAYRR